MEYNFREFEKFWQSYWAENKIFETKEDPEKKKFYVLDMFPYPSGAGLHVGHPLGYIASDIYSRYKRLKGFNVLHPMGFDAFGLPAEQYAIRTGQHPATTTENNINRYREQLSRMGFSYDWKREFRTSDSSYYKWTQWAFIKMFESYYDHDNGKAVSIDKLIAHFEKFGTEKLNVACSEKLNFSAEEWASYDEKERQETLMNYRIAYLGEASVNWCPELGTVLANDEISEGVSIRGGFPVYQKNMKQWCLRVSAYAGRLLEGLEQLDWSESLKETQKNWIGRSEGANIKFSIHESDADINVFTTRADTIFGVTFMVLAPESDYADLLTTDDRKEEVNNYIEQTKRRTERERMSDRTVSGVFTGSYAIHPFTKAKIPVWISEYVLMGYGTGAIMAVPAHDSRDYAFAKKFGLEIIPLIEGCDIENESFDAKEGKLINSDFLNGLEVKDAIKKAIETIEHNRIGERKINYRLRDAIFSRQRYWGEPFPIYYKNGIPYPLDEKDLPLLLPEIDRYLPTEDGEPPLARAENWVNKDGYPLETFTMPGFAGSSAYYLRYMDPSNDKALVSKEKDEYWRNVDLYIGGIEHATGHLIYSRFWNKFLYDIGYSCESEPFKKLVNQGMIQGRSSFVYRIKDTNTFVSYNLKDQFETTEIHVDINLVDNDRLDTEAFKNSSPEYKNAEFLLEDGQYICGSAVEKMSKSMYNVVNPDDIIDRYGADTLRLYEMFLGPIEQSKPWDMNGIDGVFRFLKKVWSLFYTNGEYLGSDEKAEKSELKTLHTLIKKIGFDIEHFSFNTSVSAFMICVNELISQKCSKKEILKPLLICLSPFCPHICEELWRKIGEYESICYAEWPSYNEDFLKEDSFKYAVSFNGKVRFTLEFPADMDRSEIEKQVLSHEDTKKWLEGKTIKKIIVVPKKIVNIVLS